LAGRIALSIDQRPLGAQRRNEKEKEKAHEADEDFVIS